VGRIRLTVLLLAGFVAACASAKTAADSANPVQPHEVTVEEACGSPWRFPVSQACLDRTSIPAVMQRASDLAMAIWRACPDNPCQVVQHSAPACQRSFAMFDQMVDANKPPSPEFDSAAKDCEQAQHEDYSCRALQADAVYRRQEANLGPEEDCVSKRCGKMGRHKVKGWQPALSCDRSCEVAWNEPTDDDCQQARDNYTSFRQKVQDAAVNAELQKTFAPPQPIIISSPPPEPPVIIQQRLTPSLPTRTTCMPLGPGVTCNSW